MRRMIVLSLTGLAFLLGSPALAGTIYTWTDDEGVKRFSNAQPPDGAENVQAMQEIQDEQSQQNRQAFDRMVEDASQEADRHFEEQAQQKAQDEQEQLDRQQQVQDQRIAQERARLQREIDAIEGRGLGPKFTLGMKENLIRQTQEKIDRLERDPDGYFND